MEAEVTHEMLHARVQAGYLLLKLEVENAITGEEFRKALATLFPDLLPQT